MPTKTKKPAKKRRYIKRSWKERKRLVAGYLKAIEKKRGREYLDAHGITTSHITYWK
jgi:hypothetical protein